MCICRYFVEKMILWSLNEPTWYSFQVRVVVPYQGPSSDYMVVRMIPDSRLPPRHLHAVHTGKTSAVIKWESPYDSPDEDLVSGLVVLAPLLIHSMVFVGEGALYWGKNHRPGGCSSAQGFSFLSGQRWGPYGCYFFVVTSLLFLTAILVPFSSLPSHISFSDLPKWIGKQKPAGHIWLSSVFVNRILLEWSYTHSFTYYLWMLSWYKWQSWSGFQSLKYLLCTPVWKSLLAPDLKRSIDFRNNSCPRLLLPPSSLHCPHPRSCGTWHLIAKILPDSQLLPDDWVSCTYYLSLYFPLSSIYVRSSLGESKVWCPLTISLYYLLWQHLKTVNSSGDTEVEQWVWVFLACSYLPADATINVNFSRVFFGLNW